MATVADKKAGYVTRTLAAVDTLLTTVSALEALTQEGIALGWVAPLGGTAPAPLVDADFVGNEYLSAVQFATIMGTLQRLDADLHAENAAILSALYLARR